MLHSFLVLVELMSFQNIPYRYIANWSPRVVQLIVPRPIVLQQVLRHHTCSPSITHC
jgi:hypothetical protein